jgi:hypothetical protein
MRKRFALLGVLALLAAALAVPATTAAASIQSSGYTYKVVYNYCSGYDPHFKVKETAAGWTAANGLTMDSSAQEFYGGRWHTIYVWNQQFYNFPANGRSHYLTGWRSYGGNSITYIRITMDLRVWLNNGVLAHKTLHSVRC